MDERKQEFQVGVMAIVAIAAAIVMIFKFGELGNRWKSGTSISIVMPDATGVYPETPVRMSGIRIGQVQSLKLVAEGRGVMAQVLIDSEFSFRNDSVARISRSLLGDGSIEIIPGSTGQPIANGDRIAGRANSDPMEVVARMEGKINTTLASFESTGHEWSRLGQNLNRLMEASGSDGVSTIERSAVAIEQFTRTMQTAEKTLASAGSLISDPRYQKQLQATLSALPELLNETRTTLQTVNSVVQEVNSTVNNISVATTPLAKHSQNMVNRLNQSLSNIETITGELAIVSRMMNQNDGTLKKLLTDPAVYRNLNSTSASMAVLLENLKPVIADMQLFSDKIARHQEILGVRGVVRGSDGAKDNVLPASFEN